MARMEEFGGGRRRRARSVACRGAARIDLMGGSTHNRGRVVGPKWVHGWVDAGWMTKILCFGQKRSPNCDFYDRSNILVIIQPYGWVRCEG
jgi:hypothetical protein